MAKRKTRAELKKEAEIKDRQGPRRPYTLKLKRLHPHNEMWHGYHCITNEAKVFYLTEKEEENLHGPAPQSWFHIEEGVHSPVVAPVEEMIDFPSHNQETKDRLKAEMEMVGAKLPDGVTKITDAPKRRASKKATATKKKTRRRRKTG